MSGALLPTPYMRWLSGTGSPLSGGLVYFYAAGSTTPQPVYHDSALTQPWMQPVVLDVYGGATIYLSALSYKVSVTDAVGMLQPGYPVDNVYDLQSTNFSNSLLPAIDNTYDIGSLVLRWKALYLAGAFSGVSATLTGALTVGTTLGVSGAATFSSTVAVAGSGSFTKAGTDAFFVQASNAGAAIAGYIYNNGGTSAGTSSAFNVGQTHNGGTAILLSFNHATKVAALVNQAATGILQLDSAGGGINIAASGAVSFDVAPAPNSIVVSQWGTTLSRAFNAGNYTAAAGAWTVNAGNVTDEVWCIVGNRMFLSVDIRTSTLTNATASVTIATPSGYTIAENKRHVGVYAVDAGGVLLPSVVTVTSGANIVVTRQDAGNFAISANTFAVAFEINFKVT